MAIGVTPTAVILLPELHGQIYASPFAGVAMAVMGVAVLRHFCTSKSPGVDPMTVTSRYFWLRSLFQSRTQHKLYGQSTFLLIQVMSTQEGLSVSRAMPANLF